MTIPEQLQSIIDNLNTALADADKFERGNASAGTRLRKSAQEAKNALQELRISVQKVKTARKA